MPLLGKFGSLYDKTELLGEGTYGEVYKVYEKASGQYRALKRMKSLTNEEGGIAATTLRELALLKHLRHPNVVPILDIECSAGEVEVIFPLAKEDLRGFMKRTTPQPTAQLPKYALPLSQVQGFTRQILDGMDYCHANRVIHRDLKPQNILVTHDLQVQLADFGLARTFDMPIQVLTHEVVTLWYRAPEILLGQPAYSLSIDIWSLGCIVIEAALGTALFMGDCEIGTIIKIFQKLGTPTPADWPQLAQCPHWKPTFPKFTREPLSQVRNLGHLVGEQGCDMVQGMLHYDPARRWLSKELLRHPWLTSGADGRVAGA